MKSILLAAAVLSGSICGTMAAPAITLEKIAEGFVSPTTLLSEPGGDLLVADQVGVIYKLKGGAEPEKWFDLTSKMTKLRNAFDERGLLGFCVASAIRAERAFLCGV